MKPIDKTTSSLEEPKDWLTDVSIVIVGIRKKLGKAIYAPDRLELEELLKHRRSHLRNPWENPLSR